MIRAATTLGLLVLAGTVLTACADEDGITPPGPQRSEAVMQLRPQDHLSIDSMFVTIAREVPGFAGLFFEQGQAVAYLVDLDQRGRAAEVLLPLFDERIGESGTSGTIDFRKATYAFLDLNEWHGQLMSLLSVAGITATDIDETRNQVVIGVEPESGPETRERIADVLREAGIPTDAVHIRESPLTQPATLSRSHTTLDSRIRPTQGGLRIRYDVFECTLGINVRIPPFGDRGFLTNSHCSTIRGSLGTDYFQSNIGSANFIGFECNVTTHRLRRW